MVVRLVLFSFILMINPVYSQKEGVKRLSIQEMKELMRKKSREQREKDSRMKSDIVDYIKSEQPEKVNPETEKEPKNDKKNVIPKERTSKGRPSVRGNSEPKDKETIQPEEIKSIVKNTKPKASNVKNQQKKAKNNDPNKYRPPIRSKSDKAAVLIDYDKVQSNNYGIVIGTWAEAELLREVSSAERSDIEIILTKEIKGKNKSLPKGTKLFGRGGFNSGTKKLDIRFNSGITPEGEEFVLNASVYDKNQTIGLPGVVHVDQDKNIEDAGKEAAFTTVSETLERVIGNGNPVTTGVRAGKDILLERNRPDTRDSGVTIVVSPQKIKIRINKTL